MSFKCSILSTVVALGYVVAAFCLLVGIASVFMGGAPIPLFGAAAALSINTVLLELFLDLYARVRRMETQQETVMQLLFRRVSEK